MHTMDVHSRYVSLFGVMSLCFAMSQGSPSIRFLNYSDPLIVKVNTFSEVSFTLEDSGNASLHSYSIFINHKSMASNTSRLKCVFYKSPGNCSSNHEECECLSRNPEHLYKLKKVFQEEDGGNWTFSFTRQRLSVNRTINIIVLSTPVTTTIQSSETSEASSFKGSNRNTVTQTLIRMSKVRSPGTTPHYTSDGITHSWHIVIIIVATCIFIAVFGLVVACTTWRCAYVHLERRNSERLACLGGVEMAESYLLTMDPVYDVIPATFHWWRSGTARRTRTVNKATTSTKSPEQPSPSSTILMSV